MTPGAPVVHPVNSTPTQRPSRVGTPWTNGNVGAAGTSRAMGTSMKRAAGSGTGGSQYHWQQRWRLPPPPPCPTELPGHPPPHGPYSSGRATPGREAMTYGLDVIAALNGPEGMSGGNSGADFGGASPFTLHPSRDCCMATPSMRQERGWTHKKKSFVRLEKKHVSQPPNHDKDTLARQKHEQMVSRSFNESGGGQGEVRLAPSCFWACHCSAIQEGKARSTGKNLVKRHCWPICHGRYPAQLEAVVRFRNDDGGEGGRRAQHRWEVGGS